MVEVPYTYVRTYTYFFISVNVALSFFFFFSVSWSIHHETDIVSFISSRLLTIARTLFLSRVLRALLESNRVFRKQTKAEAERKSVGEIIRDIDEARSKEAENRIPWEREFGNLDWLRARDN